MMSRFRRLTEFTVELTKWARLLGNEALVAIREVRWTRRKKLLATGIGCCGLLVSVATWNAFQRLEDGFEKSQPSMLPADQVSPLTDVNESAAAHAPLQAPPVQDNRLSRALHVGDLDAGSHIEQISNTGLVQTTEVMTMSNQPRGAWLLGTIESVNESPTLPEPAPARSTNYNQPLLVIPEGP